MRLLPLARRAPMAMTAHILYPAWDDQHPATLSPTIISTIIRGEIGFDGLLMTDDIAMNALSGPLAERARAALAAGCDIVLHCSGEHPDNEALVAALPPISASAETRLARAMPKPVPSLPLSDLLEKRDALLALA